MEYPIISAAIQHPHFKDLIICGVRHYDKIMTGVLSNLGEEFHECRWEQGFVDAYGVFHNRKDAWKIAEWHWQIDRLVGDQSWEDESTHELYSENLY